MENPIANEFAPAELTDISAATFKNKHLLVRLYSKKESTAAGIVLTETTQEKRLAAWVLAVADDIDDANYVVGATVTAGAYALDTPAGEFDGLALDKTPLRILKEHEVICVIPPKDQT